MNTFPQRGDRADNVAHEAGVGGREDVMFFFFRLVGRHVLLTPPTLGGTTLPLPLSLSLSLLGATTGALCTDLTQGLAGA